jgi:hypothetical protein
MKNRIKLFLVISALSLLFGMKANAQVFDGITQPTKFRVWVPVSIDLHNSKNVGVAPFVGYKQDNKFDLEKGKDYKQMFIETMKKAAQNPDDYPGYEVAKKVYARCTEATTVKTYQKMYQMLLAGDPKKRSYRVLVGDLYRDVQNRDKKKKHGRT